MTGAHKPKHGGYLRQMDFSRTVYCDTLTRQLYLGSTLMDYQRLMASDQQSSQT